MSLAAVQRVNQKGVWKKRGQAAALMGEIGAGGKDLTQASRREGWKTFSRGNPPRLVTDGVRMMQGAEASKPGE